MRGCTRNVITSPLPKPSASQPRTDPIRHDRNASRAPRPSSSLRDPAQLRHRDPLNPPRGIKPQTRLLVKRCEAPDEFGLQKIWPAFNSTLCYTNADRERSRGSLHSRQVHRDRLCSLGLSPSLESTSSAPRSAASRDQVHHT